jgi:hypothetical protein
MNTGTHGEYPWLEIDLLLDDFVDACPQAIVGRHIAVTSIDSGFFTPSEADLSNGWTSQGQIAYSPLIASTDTIPSGAISRDCCGRRFNEWFVFDDKAESLGAICHANFFETELVRGNVFAFVNACLRLSGGPFEAIATLFWKQMEWIRPAYYVSNGIECLIFTTKQVELFTQVKHQLAEKFLEPFDDEA